MKKLFSLLSVLCILCTFPLSLTSCSGEKGVPDNLAIESVRQNKHLSGRYPETVSVIHNKYDDESYLDYVTIVSKSEGKYGYYVTTCDAIFQYDRTTDLWELFGYDYIYEGSYEVWTYPEYTLNDNLVGSYDVSSELDKIYRCHIEVLEVTEQTIKLSYDVSASTYDSWTNLHIEKSGTATLENGNLSGYFNNGETTIDIPIELPAGYYGVGGVDDKYIELNLVVNLTNGIQSAYFGAFNKHYD